MEVEGEANLNKIETCSLGIMSAGDEGIRRDWSVLGDHDVLWLIAGDHLPAFEDRIAASRVCRSWQRAILSVDDGRRRRCGGGDRSRPRTYDGLPFLVYLHLHPMVSCCLIDPIHRDNHHTLEGLAGSSDILFSRDGWLLLMWGPRDCSTPQRYIDVFFVNLLSKNSKIKLPTLVARTVPYRFSFSHRPTSPSCVVVVFLESVLGHMSIAFCRPGDSQWTFLDAPSHMHFRGSSTNVVWSSGRFYWLDMNEENLGAFDPSLRSWTTFVAKQEDLGDEYLVESCAGDLLRVCSMGRSVVVVYRFDLPTGRWAPVRDLGDMALFVGKQNSMCIVAPVERMRGRVYFNAVVADNVIMSCSLKQSESAVARVRNMVPWAPRRKGNEFMSSAWVNLEWPDG